MPSKNPLNREGGFIALYALLSLAFLVGLTVLVMAHWDGTTQRLRRQGGEAQARRLAYAFIQERLAEEWTAVPRAWVPALEGEQAFEDATLHWHRRPLDGRWRAGGRAWTPEWRDAWLRLGARAERVGYWQGWLEQRANTLAQAGLTRGDLVPDRAYLGAIFQDLGLGARWGGPDRLWTVDEEGALGRLNLLGADPEALAALSGVGRDRIEAFQSLAAKGFADPGAALGYWRFDEQQALDPWAATHPFTEASWDVEVKLPNLREAIPTQWRVSQELGTPGNPWFRVQARAREQW